jgi:hypothetical protein
MPPEVGGHQPMAIQVATQAWPSVLRCLPVVYLVSAILEKAWAVAVVMR